MLFRRLALLGVCSFTAAQSSTTITPVTSSTTSPTASATATSLAGLVEQLPRCALSCFASSASSIGCSPEDFSCLCSRSTQLLTNIGPCIALGSGCTNDEITEVTQLAPEICSAVNSNPSSADVASASRIVASALATVTGTGSPSPTVAGSAAHRTRLAAGVMGAAALCAGVALW